MSIESREGTNHSPAEELTAFMDEKLAEAKSIDDIVKNAERLQAYWEEMTGSDDGETAEVIDTESGKRVPVKDMVEGISAYYLALQRGGGIGRNTAQIDAEKLVEFQTTSQQRAAIERCVSLENE